MKLKYIFDQYKPSQIGQAHQNAYEISVNLVYCKFLWVQNWLIFLDLNKIVFLNWKLMNILHFTVTIFYVLYYISFNFSPTKSYYIPNSSKYYEDSAELCCFALASLDQELEARKRVHFFSDHPLLILLFGGKMH